MPQRLRGFTIVERLGEKGSTSFGSDLRREGAGLTSTVSRSTVESMIIQYVGSRTDDTMVLS